jgi:hypothetical protein
VKLLFDANLSPKLYSFVDTSAYHIGVRIFAYRLAASMYALQALFFQYGELRDQNDLTVT